VSIAPSYAAFVAALSVTLDQRDFAYLAAACQAEDRACELDELVAREGLTVVGSTDQQRLHPGITEARLQRAQVAVLLGRVEMVPPRAGTRHLNGRQRAELRRLGANDGAA
jgi:hypothetical protein